MQNTLIVVTGPTGVGKTKLAIELARYFDTEIISADSRQIFRELSIGTAVPDSQELHTVKHHFIHSHSIHNYYNASKFEEEVLQILQALFEKYKIVIMSGGSMLYIDAVCKGIDELPLIDPEIRKEVISRYEEFGLENLRLELKKIDPEYYAQVDLKNHKRIMHALEVFYMTGKKYSSFRTKTVKQRDFDIIKIGLNMAREELHRRINARVDKMMDEGLSEEAQTVYPFKHLNTLNTVGYRELFSHFDGDITIDEAVELIKRNSRRYARKQLTWYRKDEEVHWFEPQETNKIIDFLKKRLLFEK